MVIAYLGLGANLGDAPQTLKEAVIDLAQCPNVTPVSHSSLYRSQPYQADGPDFFNMVVSVETSLDAQRLYAICAGIETKFGRKRSYRNAPRTLDIDLLLYGDQRLASVDLVIPHPRMTERAFVLHPLLELVPDLTIPVLGAISQFLPDVAGQVIEKIATPPFCMGSFATVTSSQK
ncbi:MAG: 2-amino-4-hydroxy-6-hydroxymethyldihydropteridine diphosphokinase [Ottowia sp.]|nr:2-amino-4-hydroxy-6-hydroxymethyldihydropteridine diphosphokinase [Ottowia sp.]